MVWAEVVLKKKVD
jgi:hypothetical protein